MYNAKKLSGRKNYTTVLVNLLFVSPKNDHQISLLYFIHVDLAINRLSYVILISSACARV